MDCIFCKIAEGNIPCEKVYESNNFLAFKDIYPQSEIHILVVPKQHFSDLSDASGRMELSLLGEYLQVIGKVADKLQLRANGYRTVFNTNQHACQSVFHIHAHILGGQQLSGEMG